MLVIDMFSGHDPSFDGRRGHDNTRGWKAEMFDHDKLKYHKRENLKSDGGKLLRLAAKEGDSSRVHALVRQGVNVNCDGGSHKHTALHYAARFGHVACLEALLQHNANPNMQNLDGRTALHWAASNGTAAACALLLRHGAKQSMRNKDGMTPLELAEHFNNAQTIAVLRGHGNLGPEEHAVCPERIGVWGARDVPQAPAGAAHNRHLGGGGEVSVQRVGVWHNSWAHYRTVVTPNDRRHKYNNDKGERYNHGRPTPKPDQLPAGRA